MSRNSGYGERHEDEVGRRYGREDGQDVDEATFADVYSGLSFGSKRGKKKRRSEERDPEPSDTSESPESPDQQETQRFSERPNPGPAAQLPEEHEAGDVGPGDAPAASIRSYAWTGGRTKTNVELELETLVSTGANYRPGTPLRQEYQSVVQLCGHPRSVAEVGALLGVPFGVAKVLLADMAEQGLVDVHQTVTDSGSEPHMMLMERVLSGLRRL